jgi:hypothetical protein
MDVGKRAEAVIWRRYVWGTGIKQMEAVTTL